MNQDRLNKLEAVGFAWSAKNIRKSSIYNSLIGNGKADFHVRARTNKSLSPVEDSRNSSRSRLNDSLWEDMYHRLVVYKEKFGVCLPVALVFLDNEIG
jgi:hypothetical protein